MASITTNKLAAPKLKEILMKIRYLISNILSLSHIFRNAPIVTYQKNKLVIDFLVRATIPSLSKTA